jgi:hypothetical protein
MTMARLEDRREEIIEHAANVIIRHALATIRNAELELGESYECQVPAAAEIVTQVLCDLEFSRPVCAAATTIYDGFVRGQLGDLEAEGE